MLSPSAGKYGRSGLLMRTVRSPTSSSTAGVLALAAIWSPLLLLRYAAAAALPARHGPAARRLPAPADLRAAVSSSSTTCWARRARRSGPRRIRAPTWLRAVRLGAVVRGRRTRRGHEVGAESVQSLFEVQPYARSGSRPDRSRTTCDQAPAGSPSSRSCPRGAIPGRGGDLSRRATWRAPSSGTAGKLGSALKWRATAARWELSAVDLPADLAALAYRAADAAAFDLLTRQHILSASDAAARLAVVLAAVRRERLLVDELRWDRSV